MKILFDQNISFRVLQKIRHKFPESKQVKELGLENSSDKSLWDYSKKNGYTIITFDTDFYYYSLLFGHPPKIIWLRTGNTTTNALADFLLSKFQVIKEFIESESTQDVACLELE